MSCLTLVRTMGLRGPWFEMFHWLHSLKGRFYHGGDVFTESLSCGLLLDTCRTVVRLRSTCVTVSVTGCMSVEMREVQSRSGRRPCGRCNVLNRGDIDVVSIAGWCRWAIVVVVDCVKAEGVSEGVEGWPS